MAAHTAAVLDALPLAYAARRARQTGAAAIVAPPDPLAWARRFRAIDGRPFSLDRFAPLRTLYEDDHPHIVVIKPAQRGISEWAINYTSFALERGAEVWTDGLKDGLNVAYIFPTREALGDFSKERITGLRLETPHLDRMFSGDDDFNAVMFMQVGRSFLYLRGGWSESALLSFSADVLVLDEFDRMDPKAVALARRRLNASMVRRELDISTPTIPGRGIHAQYLQSDRRVYEQRHGCGAWERYDFLRDVRVDGQPAEVWRTWPPERIRRSTVALACPACRGPVTDAERCVEGRWMAEQPDVQGLRGYWIPPLAFPFVDLATLAVAAVNPDPSEIQEFYRSDLGQPYEAGGSRVTEADLAQLSHALPNGRLPDVAWRSTTMGVDVGARFHYRVSSLGPDGDRYIRAMGAVGSWDDLDRLMARFKVRQCVVDALPELHACREWAGRHRGRVLRAFYPTAAALKGELFRVDEDAGTVQVNRTMAMDAVVAAIAGDDHDHWPVAIHADPEVIAHMTAPVRVTTTDERGQERADWVHTKPDHLFHACLVAGTLIATEHGNVPIERVRPGIRVWTRRGLRRVTAAGCTGRDVLVKQLWFTNGSTLIGTDYHPIYTKNRGFIPIDAANYDDIMLAWEPLTASPTVASSFGATRTIPGVPTGSTMFLAANTDRRVSADSIRKSGVTCTGRFLRAITSTISTAIRSITTRRISPASRLPSTCPHTPALTLPASSTWTASDPLLHRGIVQTRGVAGIASMPSVPSSSWSHDGTPVVSVDGISWRAQHRPKLAGTTALAPAPPPIGVHAGSMTRTASVLSAANPFASTAIAASAPAPVHVGVVSSVQLSGKSGAGQVDAVYNLSVDEAEEYFANGLLVHNCVYEHVARLTRTRGAGLAVVAQGAAKDSRIR